MDAGEIDNVLQHELQKNRVFSFFLFFLCYFVLFITFPEKYGEIFWRCKWRKNEKIYPKLWA